MRIEGAKILVTGGAGLIGSTTIDLLLRDHKPGSIVVLDNLSRGTHANLDPALKDRRVRLVEGDSREQKLGERLAAEVGRAVLMAAIPVPAGAGQLREAFGAVCAGPDG